MENIKFIVCDNVKWYKGFDVASVLGYVNTPKAIQQHVLAEDRCSRDKLGNIPECGFIKNESRSIYINDRGVKTLVSKSRMMKSASIAKSMNINILDHKYVTKEAETLDAITKSFAGEKMRLQHVVKDYRIDLY